VADAVKDYDAADMFYSFCTDNAINDLQSGKMIVLAAGHQIDFLTTRKKFDKVEELCDKLLVLDGDKALDNAKIGFMERQILAIAKQGETTKALDKVDKLLKAFDNPPEFMNLKALVQTEAGKLDEAIKTYKEAITTVEGMAQVTKETKTRFATQNRYRISGLHLENNQFDEAVKILEELKNENPDNPTFYNDLGYLLADHDKRLDDAEKFVRKALELDAAARKKLLDEKKIDEATAKKATPAYVDSMGWVLYKNKKYAEALPLLVEASQDEDEGNHIEIWDHVGDCQLAMGKKKEALETFQKALKLEDVSKKDTERRKKITEKIKKLKSEL
jgi:tetratricopeptide (TPR) repeat protein